MKLTLQNSAWPLVLILAIGISNIGISGGPNYGGSKKFVNVYGTYAGSLQPAACSPSSTPAANTLGLFTAQVPRTGLATGQFSIYAEGRTFDGSFSGLPDPDHGRIYANLTARTHFDTDSNANIIIISFTPIYHADGVLTAEVKASKSSNISSERLVGNATVTVTHSDFDGNFFTDGSACYVVKGYKQSNL